MKVIVIGGGPAGMIAAMKAAQDGCQVTLIEKNEKLGKKLYITGKGRCNVTNACDIEDLFENMVTNKEFMYSSFYMYTNQALMDQIEALGCPLKVERGNRVFPKSDHSSDVIGALKRGLNKEGVKILLNTPVNQLMIKDNIIQGVKLEDGQVLEAHKVIVATGGKSYPSTGSTGDGYDFAKQAGHTVTKLTPALVPFRIKEDLCKELQGLSLRNVKVTMTANNKKVYEDFGEMIFTHFGISGPVVLSASSYVKQYEGANLQFHIDLKAALTTDQLDQRILRDFKEMQNKAFKNSLNQLLPKKMIPIIIKESGIDEHKKVNEITKVERQQLIDTLKNLTLTIEGVRGFEEAIVTQGGVHVKEINPSTMESKKVQGLHFAGEVLDLDAVTGGFNLQIAWSTGYLAGTKQEDEDV